MRRRRRLFRKTQPGLAAGWVKFKPLVAWRRGGSFYFWSYNDLCVRKAVDSTCLYSLREEDCVMLIPSCYYLFSDCLTILFFYRGRDKCSSTGQIIFLDRVHFGTQTYKQNLSIYERKRNGYYNCSTPTNTKHLLAGS